MSTARSTPYLVIRLLYLGVAIEQVNYLAGYRSRMMTKRLDYAREKRYGGVIEALDEVDKTSTWPYDLFDHLVNSEST